MARTVTANPVTDIDRLDELGGRIERNDRLTPAEVAAGISLCERYLDNTKDGDRSDDTWLAVHLLGRLDAHQTAERQPDQKTTGEPNRFTWTTTGG